MVQYINGILKQRKKEERKLMKNNLTLFTSGGTKPVTAKRNINEVRKKLRKTSFATEETFKISEIGVLKGQKISQDTIKLFHDLDDYEKLKIEERALKLCSKQENIDVGFLLTLKEKSITIYLNTIRQYIASVLEEGL